MNSMWFFLLGIILAGLPVRKINGQIKVDLSEKHLNRVNKQSTASKKLALYRKYFKKDSIKSIKGAERYWQGQTDSLADAIAQRELALTKRAKGIKDGIDSKVYRTLYKPWAKKQARDQIAWLDDHGLKPSFALRRILLLYFEDHFLRTTQNDSLLTVLKAQMPSLHMPKQLSSKAKDFQLINPRQSEIIQETVQGRLNGLNSVTMSNGIQEKLGQYSDEAGKYSQYGEMLGNRDSLESLVVGTGERIIMNSLSKTEQYSQLGKLKQYGSDVDKFKSMHSQYRLQGEQLQDSAYIKSQAKEKAEELAMKYIADHPEIMQGVQKKMNMLMKKYSVVHNSNDLSTAVKRTSLKGKPFRQRVYFAANIQLLTLEPVNIDFSPMAGYRISKNFLAGLGMNYRQSFGDSISTVSPNVFGYKAFSSYDVLRNFFAYGEFDRNTSGIQRSGDFSQLTWNNAAFLGLGRKMRIHPKIEMTMMFLYNFLHDHPDPVYPKKWNVRIGIQTSAVAMFKPKPTFK